MKKQWCDRHQDYYRWICPRCAVNILRDPAVGIIVQIVIINMLIVVAYYFGQYNAIQMHEWANSCGNSMNLTEALNLTKIY
jgi:hypothetical protein